MTITRLLALFVTLTAMSMAGAAAWDRGGNAIDRVLLVALSFAICAGAHLIPALSKRNLAWILWGCCLIGTVYSHLTFFTHASLRAGDYQAQHSVQVIGTAKQIEAANEALAEIKARPIAIVGSDIANSQDWRQRRALKLELAEAHRAATLRDELLHLAGTATKAEVTESSDPVTARLSTVTGSSEASIGLAVGLGFSILLELVGALLWYEALQHPKGIHAAPCAPIVVPDSIATLQIAVADGRCKATVAGIRAYLGCSQAKALELRRVI